MERFLRLETEDQKFNLSHTQSVFGVNGLKKILALLLIIAVTGYFYFIYEPPGEIDIIADEQNRETADPLVIEDGVIFIPAELLFAKLGAETEWDEENKILKAAVGDYSLSLPVGSEEITVNGETINWKAAVKLIEGEVYVPAGSCAETLGAFVRWDPEEKTLVSSSAFDPDYANGGEGPLLHLAYPYFSGFRYYANSLFIFGTTKSYSQTDVTVNGKPVDIIDRRSGNFLAVIDIPRGEEFLLRVEATGNEGTTVVERTVIYPAAWQPMALEPLAIHPENVVPGENQILSQGDDLRIAVQGTPGADAEYKIEGASTGSIQMTERAYPGGPRGEGGIYSASYAVTTENTPASGLSGPHTVTVTLQKNGQSVSRELPGKIYFSAGNPYRVVEVKEEHLLKNQGWLYIIQNSSFQISPGTLGGTGFNTGVISYLVEGTLYKARGISGGYYRVEVDGNNNYLIHRASLRELPEIETLEPYLEAVELSETAEKVTLRLKTSERFPFLIKDGKNRLALSLYGLKQTENTAAPRLTPSVNYFSLEPCRESNVDSLVLTIGVEENMTAFERYWDGNELVLEIYKPQTVNENRLLKGKTIIVDPGHGGSDFGATGPGGVHEKDVNLPMALHLRDLLTLEGANVIMTRTEDEYVNLYDRPENINRYNADLLISIHSNAHAHGGPALDTRGIMILYNYEHNRELAEIMLEKMVENTELPAFRTWRRNIAVLRHSQVPSVLVEAGYLMHPEDNWHVLHPRGQRILARSMLEGIKEYFRTFVPE